MPPQALRSLVSSLLSLTLTLTLADGLQQEAQGPGVTYNTQNSPVRPAFRKQPENSSVTEGEGARLECEVEPASGQVQWVRDGLLLGPTRDVPGFPRYSVAGSAAAGVFNLQIDSVQLEDDASFQCQVAQSPWAAGIVSRTAWLDVLVAPRVSLEVKRENGEGAESWVVGNEYIVQCTASNAKPTPNITFTKDGVAFSGSEATVMPGSKAKLFSTVSVIRIIPEIADNGKEVVCSVMNPALSAPITRVLVMNVLYPPEVPSIEGHRKQVAAGETLHLVCTSRSGNPLATLQWLKLGLQEDVVVSQKWEADIPTRSSRSFLSYRTQPEDDGVTLSCEALNEVTVTPLRAIITLNVLFPPHDVSILGSPTVIEGDRLVLSCVASSSNPAAQLWWYRSGRELSTTEVTHMDGGQGGVTTVSNVTFVTGRQDNGMTIVCEAVNEALFISQSVHVVINVHYPPERIWIQGPPRDSSFVVGSEVTLSCFTTGGNPPPDLHWRKGSTALPSGVYQSTGKLAMSKLTITAVASDNLADYQCSAKNPATRKPLAAVTRIRVQFAPIDMNITSAAEVVHKGELINLTCHTGSSNPVAEISWIRDGIRVAADWLKREEAEYGGVSLSAGMTITASPSDNGKRVTCEAYSAVLEDTVNSFYQLNILHRPEFLTDQVDVIPAQEHGAALLPIRISANPSDVTYTWSRNRHILGKAGKTRHHLNADGSLEIWNLTREDAGFYRIQVSNQEGESERLIHLDVKYSPQIYWISDPAEVDLGGSVELLCCVDANPLTSEMLGWIWMDEGRKLTDVIQVSVNNSARLQVNNVERSHAGSYQCWADNGIPPSASATAQLIVRFKPHVWKAVSLAKRAVSGDGSDSANLTCNAEGIPDVSFHWARNGVTLDLNNPRYLQETVHDGPVHTGLLRILNVTANLDYATFSCTAQNPLGLDTFHIELVSTGPPDPPTGLELVRKNHNAVSLAWDPAFDGGLPQTFQIRYKRADSLRHLYVDVYPPESGTFTVTGLVPGTEYNFSIRALNALGSSGYADSGRGLTVVTAEHPGQDPFPTESDHTPPPRPGDSTIPLLVTFLLLVILLNVGIAVSCVHRLRERREQAGKNDGSSSSEGGQCLQLNDYEDVTSVQTVSAESESEPRSIDNSYEEASSQPDHGPDPRSSEVTRGHPQPESGLQKGPGVPQLPGFGQSVLDGLYRFHRPDPELPAAGIYEDVSDEPHGKAPHCPPDRKDQRQGLPGRPGPGPGFCADDELFEMWGELV
ncbi:nephrin [Stegostoma tigrinum]|uniref:nephrin n=1 Tax=Stegostoma tigrinum TaxID=3053191 RepID=UPI00286FE905|nr:nephrin [Stegostoma tigrinum]